MSIRLLSNLKPAPIVKNCRPPLKNAAARSSLDGNDVERDRNIGEFRNLLDINPSFTDDEKAVLLSEFESQVQLKSVANLLEAALADSDGADRMIAKASVLLGSEFTPDITPEQRLILRRSINQVESIVQQKAKKSEESRSDQAELDFAFRFA